MGEQQKAKRCFSFSGFPSADDQKKKTRQRRVLQKLVKSLFLDLGSLTNLVTKVIELSAVNVAATSYLDLLDLGRVNRESTLYTNREADLANREGLTGRSAMTADNIALEDLDALAVAFLNAVVNLYVCLLYTSDAADE